MIYIETGSTDVYYNFGLEYYFAAEKKLPEPVLLFWRTTPTLMVGKYQNILEEINKPYADAHKIRLVRRMSGGGTIYTDLGGWQFTFIEHSDQTQIDFSQYIGPVVDAVRELGDILPDLLRLAEIEKATQLLAAEIERTRRRVNALEYVKIPQIQQSIKYITMKLDENERANTIRLMKVKDMILQEAIEERRQTDAAEGAGV